ncbi:replication protein A 70 kDa DNA-binding subunit D-like [Arachis duranensis]|uniref:Replication protein A 70 kDa DNA-binding subunit D-like n=1 Tax=Arachis duranensis TaxID=130453 RepID=A0A9C6WRE6_ARADU|nr:replication protein A 70 kDa DNA-binding subunit D-like [Arachis duranensis]
MNHCIVPLKKITPWKHDWSIRVKIIRLWKETAVVEGSKQELLQLILMDEHLEKVQATVKHPDVAIFSGVLKERNIYEFSNFIVVPNLGALRVTKHKFQIIFNEDTSVINSPDPIISSSGLELSCIDEILGRKVDYDYLVDFIGILCDLRRGDDIDFNGKSFTVMILQLYANGKKIQCNIIGEFFPVLDITLLTKFQRAPVIVLQSFKVKVKTDKVILQNVLNVSTVSVNPDLEESVDFLSQFSIAKCHFSRLIHADSRGLYWKIDDETFDWRLMRTIANLKSNEEDGQFFVLGKITSVVDDPEWWYFCCICGHPIVGNDNVFRCHLCNRESEHVIVKYRVKVIVEDGTSTAMFVLLDTPVTKLLGKTCSEAFLVKENNHEGIQFLYCPTLFQHLVGMKTVFQIQTKRVNNKGYCGTFKVINVLGDPPFFEKAEVEKSDNVCRHPI